MVKDIVIGMADGLTVPFALAAGISGAVDSIHIVVVAGLAEIASGAISMGLGGYLSARTYEELYQNERKRELYEIDALTDVERQETRDIFSAFGLSGKELEDVVSAIQKDKNKWADFMMRYELNLELPNPKRAPISAMTIGGAYVVGGLIPLTSYMLLDNIESALIASIVSTLTALGIFGAVKGWITGIPALRGALQTMFVGGLAAGVAYGIARFISG